MRRRLARYLRESGEKSSKSGAFRTGKIIPSNRGRTRAADRRAIMTLIK
jgi:hypothetical protein